MQIEGKVINQSAVVNQSGIQPEVVVDMLQGGVSQSALTRHYLVPQSSLKDQVLDTLKKLQRQL